MQSVGFFPSFNIFNCSIKITNNDKRRFLETNDDEIGKFQSSYSVLKDQFGTQYGILFFPYFEDV